MKSLSQTQRANHGSASPSRRPVVAPDIQGPKVDMKYAVETIVARRVLIPDSTGQVRIAMSVEDGPCAGPEIQVFDMAGTPRLDITAWQDDGMPGEDVTISLCFRAANGGGEVHIETGARCPPRLCIQREPGEEPIYYDIHTLIGGAGHVAARMAEIEAELRAAIVSTAEIEGELSELRARQG